MGFINVCSRIYGITEFVECKMSIAHHFVDDLWTSLSAYISSILQTKHCRLVAR